MKKLYILWILLISLVFAGCKADDSIEEGEYWIFHVNTKKSTIEKTKYKLEDEEMPLTVTEIVDVISGKRETEVVILPSGVELLGYSLTEGVLKLNFNSNYRKIASIDEILYRAALVKNFVQLKEVSYVEFYIEEEALQDASGNPIGLLNNASFVEFSGENLGDIQSKRLILYFANEAGAELVSETRTVYYTSSAPVEKVVVSELIQGPEKSNHYATLPANTGIIGVSVANGVVYVNLDQKVWGDSITLNAELSIYSIVNSVLAVGNATQVQISINGDTKTAFKGVELNKLFAFNTEILEGTEEYTDGTSKVLSEEEDE